MNQRKRVVITGIGAMTPLALNWPDTWESLLAGKSGVGPVTKTDPSPFPSKIAGELKGWDPAQYIGRKEIRRMAECSQLAVSIAHEALADAGLEAPLVNGDRVGTLMGTAVGGFEQGVNAVDIFREKGLARLSPYTGISMLTNMPSHHVSLWARATGPISTVIAACATGNQAVGEAADFIRLGAADVMICGGVEALMHFTVFATFCAMRGLSTRNDEPEKASRPFDADRDGFVYSEGGAIMVLESLEHAQARGAHIKAEVLGYASSSDAFHAVQPHPQGEGAIRAMRRALENSGIQPDDVDYINTHGSSTPLNDAVETQAIKDVFGKRAYKIAINSTKSMIGHCMGGAGAIEAAVCTQSVQEGIVHPTINLETPDPECDLDYVPEGARKRDVRVAITNSFGLGGQNACLAIGRYEE
jgi:beta-ketoacyl-acyl-carrier-protein synthase II